MRRIGVISDTHGLLRDQAIELLKGVDHIVHAGDIGRPEIINDLHAIAPVSAIRGDIDVDPWALKYPETLHLTLFGHRLFILHDRKNLGFAPGEAGAGLIISGHSHRSGIESIDGIVYLNPGSAGPRRFNLPVTLATVEIVEGVLTPIIHHLG